MEAVEEIELTTTGCPYHRLHCQAQFTTEPGSLPIRLALLLPTATPRELGSRAPRCGSGPNYPLEGPPPPPPLQLKDASLKPQPFPHHPLPPSFPTHLGSILQEPAAQVGVGEGSTGAGGWRGNALQAALGARPTFGGTQ